MGIESKEDGDIDEGLHGNVRLRAQTTCYHMMKLQVLVSYYWSNAIHPFPLTDDQTSRVLLVRF
ncbi:hypothetical protein NC653_020670 [Populus alba x Populus x berolinensis]|uniref:Uncharacterized protein n=1 Tax=Populus alba x Populus x berolinensis TaxID=444605 RepID=A0AAD6QEJ6_9ROSI|nr:hypothetical protein NC653_020670 [Populus alba x Populus x berolinensis]